MSTDFTFENYEYAPINKTTSFVIKPKVNSKFNTKLKFDIISPSGTRLDGKIEEKSSNYYLLRCIPKEIGNHEIIFYCDHEKQIRMMTFICQVFDAKQIRLSDLPAAIPHRPYVFTGP